MTVRHSSSISHLVRLLRSTLSEIGREPSSDVLESMSFLVYQAMTGRSREYHGMEHVFAVAGNLPPLARLAAIYHDTVYHQIDRGFNPTIWERIKDACVVHTDAHITVATQLDEKIADVAMIFGFEPGQKIGAFGGLNEFLSAVVALRELDKLIDRKEAWTIAACIELTIPFRANNAKGWRPTQVLRERLVKLAALRRVKLTENEIDEAVCLATRVANADVQSFAQADVGAFLDDTWKLLPETNPQFRSVGNYSIRSYREALSKTEAFLFTLDPQVIFQQHRGAPGDRLYGLMYWRAEANLAKGCEYLRAKVVTIAVLEALADITGGDAPVSYFTGAADSGEVMAYELLPEDQFLSEEGNATTDPMVLHILRYGRPLESGFDLSKSPLSAHVYEILGTMGINAQAARVKQVTSGQKDWRWFLDGFPHELISVIARAVAEIAVERRAKLLKIANKGLKPRKAAA